MTTTNSSYTFGDGNIDLQNISDSTVNITYTSQMSPKVQEKKKAINERLRKIIDLLADFEKSEMAKEKLPTDADEDAFDRINWDYLTSAIKMNECVVFIGPELSQDNEDESLHEAFNESLEDYDLMYSPKEGFFMPGSDINDTVNDIRLNAASFYAKKFPKKNKKARTVLEKLAKVPIPLIISVAPDDTMHRIFRKYNIQHNFYAYNGNQIDADEPTAEKPVIYNMLGSCANAFDKSEELRVNYKLPFKATYIYTHEDFYKYMKQSHKVRMPANIDAVNFICLWGSISINGITVC